MKYELDMQDSYFSGMSVGETKGRQEGINDERNKAINSFYAYLKYVGYTLENAINVIEEFYGIPKSEIQKIINLNNKVSA